MERMMDLEEMLRELSEKYKNSKSVEVYEEDLEGWFKIIDDLREENKNLNIKVASLEGEIKGLNSVIGKLKEENQTLELWLDRKEKLNEKYRKEIDKYKKQYQHSMGEDNGKLTKGGYASFNEYGELMEEDTLQELRDLGKI